MPVRRYPRQLFNQEWKVKPRRGSQRKPWNKYVGELFEALGLREELLDDIKKGQCPAIKYCVCILKYCKYGYYMSHVWRRLQDHLAGA